MIKIYLSALSLLITSNVFAGECGKPNVYEDIECYQAQLKKDKATLNSIYDSLNRGLDLEGKKQLELSQKAWLSYRDAQCNGLMGYYGSQSQGAGSALINLSCVSEKVGERIRELRALN